MSSSAVVFPEPYLSQVARRLNLWQNTTIECSLCYESTSFVGVGACDHREICWLCSLRLRWICNDTDCAICKEPLGTLQIICIGDEKEITPLEFNGVIFSSVEILNEAKRLMTYPCPYACGEDPLFQFRSLSDLQTHLKRDHGGIIYCTICLDHRQCFLPEQPLFGPSELTIHHKAEHPSCDFCSRELKFYSTDELIAHMNQSHFKCVVCDRLDYRNEYYANFDCLDNHFADSHYRCEFPECREQRFVVFADEQDLGLHMLEKHGRGRGITGSSGVNLRKKLRNRNSQTPVNLVVHFRGPRVPSSASRERESLVRYPDLTQEGHRYDRRVHSRIVEARPRWMLLLASSFKTKTISIQIGSQEYRDSNVDFLKRISETVPKEIVNDIKTLSVKFTQGPLTEILFLRDLRDLLGKVNDQTAVDLIRDLIRLMPDQSRRDKLISYILAQERPPRVEKKTVNTKREKPVDIEIPDGLFEVGSKKPCLIQALNAVIESRNSTGSIPQSILAAMENKINGLDRVQLSTLSEMREQLLTLAEGRVKDVSWTQCESILALRPLLYRVMQIPESHKSKELELMATGWRQFVQATNQALEKFNTTELAWMKAYVALCVVRMSNIGVTETRRQDFPSLPMSAYFPSVSESSAPTTTVPTRHDFPVGLPVAPVVGSLMPTAISSTQWRNSRQALRDEAFPELVAPPAVTTSKPDMSKPWNCPRCTFRNTRALARTCEICGMERPSPGEDTGSESPQQASEPSSSTRPKRTKQKIILSSSTQRDYTR